MQYLSIKNWGEYQHYKHRNPPWIKLYYNLLDDYEYGNLDDRSKLLLISLFLLAGKTNNKIPYDIEWIQAKAMIKDEVNIANLLETGFLHVNGDK